jgi:Skp family chaperone for outer membrane proteins
MKKYFALSILLLALGFKATAQSRGIKIGYIDMEYILQNVPDYAEAKNQLEQKAQKWKQDIETKKVEIAKLKDALKTESALNYTKSSFGKTNTGSSFYGSTRYCRIKKV